MIRKWLTSRGRRRLALGLFAASTACALPGCVPHDRLHFEKVLPTRQLAADQAGFDTNLNGRVDFTLSRNAAGQIDTLSYDDNEDGQPDRRFRLSDYDQDRVPHLIVLVDSLPFAALRDRLASEDGGWSVLSAFAPPVKVIAPYPSMSALCFSQILDAPPMPGTINKSFDPRPQHNQVNDLIPKRLNGYRNPWQQRLAYNISYHDNTMAFLQPRPWMKVEFERARQAFDNSPHRTTVVYISSTAAMLMQYGDDGLDQTLETLEAFVTQVLYERRGAVKISVLSDHGHNLVPTSWIDVEKTLKHAGFRVVDTLKRPDDVYIEMDGLLTFFGVHTQQPVAVADALLKDLTAVQTVSYMEGFDVVVRNHHGAARVSIDEQGLLTYTPGSADVLGYGPALSAVALSRDQWFQRTADLEYPDAPARLWDAFHGGTQQTPQVMVSLDDGHCAGIGWFRWFIEMYSSHGGLNQVNSAAVLLTMRPGVTGPLRSGEVFNAIAPQQTPLIVSPSQQ